MFRLDKKKEDTVKETNDEYINEELEIMHHDNVALQNELNALQHRNAVLNEEIFRYKHEHIDLQVQDNTVRSKQIKNKDTNKNNDANNEDIEHLYKTIDDLVKENLDIKQENKHLQVSAQVKQSDAKANIMKLNESRQGVLHLSKQIEDEKVEKGLLEKVIIRLQAEKSSLAERVSLLSGYSGGSLSQLPTDHINRDTSEIVVKRIKSLNVESNSYPSSVPKEIIPPFNVPLYPGTVDNPDSLHHPSCSSAVHDISQDSKAQDTLCISTSTPTDKSSNKKVCCSFINKVNVTLLQMVT